MSAVATCARRLQFEAGPETEEFAACEAHRADLERGDVTCFFALRSEPMRELDPEDEIECDLCREG